jgi:hypothetical protein
MLMNEEEMIEALMQGAVIRVSDSGKAQILALDDLSPKARECYRASTKHDRAHVQQCADCLESEAENVLMDAASHREDGNEAIAPELEAEAETLRIRAATIRRG